MDDLIIKVLAGAAFPFEEERLRRWREADVANDLQFREAAEVWALTEPEPVSLRKLAPSVEEILGTKPRPEPSAEVLSKLGPAPPSRQSAPALPLRSTPSRTIWTRVVLLAASVAAVGLGITLYSPGTPSARAVYDAPTGTRTVTLSDGSFARLAQGSTLTEWDVEGRREVTLAGLAFFAIARDESRPFEVETSLGTISVLGTRFQVDASEEEVETAVVGGVVGVANDLGSIEVSAGSVASMRAGALPSAREVDHIREFLSWPEGTLVFQATPLADVVAEVSGHFGKIIRIDEAAGSDLGQRRITAWFQDEPFEAVAESLCLVAEAVCETVNDTVTMALPPNGRIR